MPDTYEIAVVLKRYTPLLLRAYHGIQTFCRESGVCRCWSRHAPLHMRELLDGGRCDGIVIFHATRREARQCRGLRVPAVSFGIEDQGSGLPQVLCDNHAAGRLGAENLLARHFFSFGYYDPGGGPAYALRKRGFVDTLRRRGFSCRVLRYSEGQASLPVWQQRSLEWLHGLPKPAGIMAPQDYCAMRMAQTCRQAGVAVPEQAALLGVDNDQAMCDATTPPLSSVDLQPERWGCEAARLLLMLLRKEKPIPALVKTPPRGVVERQSTDSIAARDELVREALVHIRRDVARAAVTRIASAMSVSQRTLLTRFRRALGHTPHYELRQARLRQARELLVCTDLDLAQVAERSGFRRAQRLCAVFHEVEGCTPAGYRRRFRSRGWNDPPG